MNLKTLSTITVITVVTCYIFYEQVAAAVMVVGYSIAGLVCLIAGLAFFFGGWYFFERLRIIRATRIETEKQAHVMTVVTGNQVFIRDTNPRAYWRAAHLDNRIYANGQYSEPTTIETRAWERFNAPKAVSATTSALLPEAIETEPLDLLTVFTQPSLSFAIIGGQQSGKTFQAQHIANYWVSRGLRPIVIGPKWDRGEWGGCILLGGNGDFAAVGWGIALIRRIVEARHANSTKTHKEHKILPVFFDDWTPIVDAVPNARQLVLEATTLYASVNVLLYFILHSDTAYAWGVDRKGAALKDNFIKLFLVPQYDQSGLIIRDQTRAYIRFAGESMDRPTKLFTTPPIPMGRAITVKPTELREPSQTEAQILKLFKQGVSYNQIARQVYGHTGGKQTQQIKDILAKFNQA